LKKTDCALQVLRKAILLTLSAVSGIPYVSWTW